MFFCWVFAMLQVFVQSDYFLLFHVFSYLFVASFFYLIFNGKQAPKSIKNSSKIHPGGLPEPLEDLSPLISSKREAKSAPWGGKGPPGGGKGTPNEPPNHQTSRKKRSRKSSRENSSKKMGKSLIFWPSKPSKTMIIDGAVIKNSHIC